MSKIVILTGAAHCTGFATFDGKQIKTARMAGLGDMQEA